MSQLNERSSSGFRGFCSRDWLHLLGSLCLILFFATGCQPGESLSTGPERDSKLRVSKLQTPKPKVDKTTGEMAPGNLLLPASDSPLPVESFESAESTQATAGVSLDTLVVSRRDWKTLLQPWAEYRQQQGHQIGWLEIPESAERLRQTLKDRYQSGLRYVLLVGDIPELGNSIHDGEGIPTGVIPGQISHRFGGPDVVATDNWYVDFDGDHAPELAIGRWALDTPEELEAVIEKTIRFETDGSQEAAQRRIEFVAGVGGFGYLQDKLIESTASRLLTDLLPGHHEVRMTHASWRSVYCPGPDRYQQAFFDSLNRGSLFWVYMGHGSPRGLDTAVFPDKQVATINTRNMEKLKSVSPPIALLLACSTGEFANAQDCLAERMVAEPLGPVAAIGGTGVTAPYGLSSFGFEMLSYYRNDAPTRLGDWVMQAKRRMLAKPEQQASESAEATPLAETELQTETKPHWGLEPDDYRKLLRQLAGLFSPTSDMLQVELEEHVEMMTLFGDPLLRLPQYEPIELQADTRPDGKIEVRGRMNDLKTAEIQIELVHPLDHLSFRPEPRNRYRQDAEFHQQFEETYEKANNRLIQTVSAPVENGTFSITLNQLTELPRRMLVRACVSNPTCKALGVCEVLQANDTQETKTQESKQPEGKQETQESNEEETATAPFAKTLEQDPDFQADGEPIVLFDQKSLNGWKKTNFGGEQDVFVTDDGLLQLDTGYPMTGITFQGTSAVPAQSLPKENYELQLRVKKVDGGDFFAGLTFEVGDQPCSFIAGGWGGQTVGLSSVDGKDAARNDTRTIHRFPSDQWYLIRIRVTTEKIVCWIDDKQVVDQDRSGHEFSVRSEVEQSRPLGFCNFQTTSQISDFRVVRLKPKTKQENSERP